MPLALGYAWTLLPPDHRGTVAPVMHSVARGLDRALTERFREGVRGRRLKVSLIGRNTTVVNGR